MRTESYCEDILKKQEQLIAPAKECDLVICGGDVYHQKKAHKISHALVNKLMEIYREFPRLYIVPGNHDIDTVMDWGDRPLGTLEKLPKVLVLHEGIVHFGGANFWCYGGGEFFDLDSLKDFVVKNKAPHVGTEIGVFHAAIAEKEYKFPTIHPGWLEPNFDLFLLGHLHDYQAQHGKIVAPGALSRGVLNIDQSLERKVCYAVIEIVGESIKTMLHSLRVKSVDEIFKMEEKKDNVHQQKAIESFVSYIEKLKIPKGMSREQLLVFIDKQDVSEPVKREAKRILEGLDDV
jgi:DNA repair exonuclease SbcCD nuclease subunit